MRWPWQQTEQRQNATDLAVDAIVSGATSWQSGTPSSSTLAAVETAASLWGRSLSRAEVAPPFAVAALTPQLLAQIGRQLLLKGEFFAQITVSNGRLALVPASSAEVRGGDPDPLSWSYRLHISVPNGSIMRTVRAEDVFHVRYGARPSTPWAGRSPLTACSTDISVLSGVLGNLAREARHPTSTLVSMPFHVTDESAQALRKQVASKAGEPRIVGVGHNNSGAVKTVHIGPDLPGTLRELASDETRAIWAAAGMPPGLFAAEGDGTAVREAQRRFLSSTVYHLAGLVQEEMRLKLDPASALKLDHLRDVQVQGQARAMAALVKAGVSIPEALRLAGLD